MQPFLLNVLKHPDFVDGTVNTSFIGENPLLLAPMRVSNRWVKNNKKNANTVD